MLLLFVVNIFVYLISFTSLCTASSKQKLEPYFSTSDVTRLHHDLFDDNKINPHVLPVFQSNASIEVAIKLEVTNVHSLDSHTGVLSVNGLFTAIWKDLRVTWNPVDYGGLRQFRIPRSYLWQPDITVLNNAIAKDMDRFGNALVDVFSTGEIMWVTPVTFQTTCTVDFLFYPFDEQVCPISFSSWMYGLKTIQLVLANNTAKDPVPLVDYSSNPEWQLVKTTSELHLKYYECCLETSYSYIVYKLHLRRHYPSFIYVIVVPSLMTIILSVVIFRLSNKDIHRIIIGGVNCSMIMHFLLFLGWFVPQDGLHIPKIIIASSVLFIMAIISLILCVALFAIGRCNMADNCNVQRSQFHAECDTTAYGSNVTSQG